MGVYAELEPYATPRSQSILRREQAET